MRRVAWILLLIFAFAVPWEFSLYLSAPLGDIARTTGLVLLLCSILAVLHAGRMRAFGPMQWLALALILWFFCTYLWTIDAAATLERMRACAQVMMTIGLVWELAESEQDIRSLLRAYVAGSWVLALLTLADFVSASAGQVRFAAEGQDPNDVARFLNMGLPMAALLLLSDRRRWQKALAAGYLPVGLLGVLLTASRGGLLAALVAIAGCALLLIRFHHRMLPGAVLSLPACAAVFWFVVPRATLLRLATIPEQLARGDLNQRLDIWAAGSRAFSHAPLFGSGAGSFVAAAGLARIDTAHNSALAITVEGGLVALGIALAIVVAAWRSVLRTQGPVRIALGTALLVWLITSLAATVEWNRSTWFLLSVIAVAARFHSGAPAAATAACAGDTQITPRHANPEPAA